MNKTVQVIILLGGKCQLALSMHMFKQSEAASLTQKTEGDCVCLQ